MEFVPVYILETDFVFLLDRTGYEASPPLSLDLPSKSRVLTLFLPNLRF